MNKVVLSAALAGLLATTVASSAQAQDAKGEREKCYGVAEAGKNDCKSADGKHGCQGHATKDNDPNEWKFVAKGECTKKGGKLEAPKA